MLSIQELLNHSNKKLKYLKTSILDSEVILSYVINKTREYILTNPNHKITKKQESQFNKLIARRKKSEPIAYIINNKEFYGRNFYVDKRVHIPKPATEDLIDAIKHKLPKNFSGAIADIGTGSGCIAITLALEFPKSKIIATDISNDALNIARKNAKILNVTKKITFLKGNLLDPIKKPVNIIIANLPYGWNGGWTKDKEVFFQPKISYEAKDNGLELINKLIENLPTKLKKGGKCFLEFDPRQVNFLNKKWKIIKDSANFDRIAIITQN